MLREWKAEGKQMELLYPQKIKNKLRLLVGFAPAAYFLQPEFVYSVSLYYISTHVNKYIAYTDKLYILHCMEEIFQNW